MLCSALPLFSDVLLGLLSDLGIFGEAMLYVVNYLILQILHGTDASCYLPFCSSCYNNCTFLRALCSLTSSVRYFQGVTTHKLLQE